MLSLKHGASAQRRRNNQGRIQAVSVGGRFQLYLVIKSHYGFTAVLQER